MFIEVWLRCIAIIIILIIIARTPTSLAPSYLDVIPEPTDEDMETTETATPGSALTCVVHEESPDVLTSPLLGLHSAR